MANIDTTKSDPQGYGKSVAAVLAGAFSTIAIYVYQRATGDTLPAEIAAAVQTLFTTVAVFVVPHTLGGGK